MVSELYIKLKKLNVNIQVMDGKLDIQAPKGVLDSTLLQEIKAQKDHLISFINLYHGRNDLHVAIPRADQQQDYELSSAQRRLWVLSQLDGNNPAYNIPGHFIFEGFLDRAALADALENLVIRHESLRTVFRENDQGEARQVILHPSALPFRLAYEDLRENEEQDLKVRELVETSAGTVFNLSTGPLIRAALYQLTDTKWLFTCTLHHIISDGWSLNVLIKELMVLYNAFAKGDQPPLLPLRIQYKDYAGWQQTQLSGAELQRHRSFWLNKFSGELPVLELSTDRPRPAVITYRGGTVKRRINEVLTRALKTLASEEGGTLFMGLTALLNALLFRYTGQKDLVIGSPVSGREHADLDDQIGFYVNILALRTIFSADDSFRSLLRNVRAVTLEAQEHQAFPFDELVDSLDMQRDTSRHPVFDVLLALQNGAGAAAKSNVRLGDLQVSRYESFDGDVSKFDLSFNFAETGEELEVFVEYNSDIYNKSTIVRLSSHLCQLLEAIVADPDMPVNKLNYLQTAEIHELLHVFNHEVTNYPYQYQTVITCFEEQVNNTPDKIALVFEDTRLSYHTLNEKANQLAHYLRSLYAVVPEDLVGVRLDRSEWLMIVIIGILKAGAGYLPIDTANPEDRVKYMLADGQCKLAIDEEELQKIVSELPAYSTKNPDALNTENDLAYVMYTSGSTGRPKGVVITHQSIIRLVKETNYTALTGNEVLLSAGAISFDAVTFEYWGMLLNGGTLVLCRKEVLLDEKQLSDLIHTQKISTMFFTSGWLNHLVDRYIGLFEGLKTVLTGGDKLSATHIQALRAHYPALEIIHCYGPTENTTFSLTDPIAEVKEPAPIGKPIRNSTAYITDELGQLCPVGVVGEICVGGIGLAREYLNNPSLTAETFVNASFGHGIRLYRTGDLGKWMEDGNIAFMGRKDTQVKIRGYRIEPGEIEHELQSYPGIDAAVVGVKLNVTGEKELVAYMVSRQALDVTEILAYLNQRLPVYMRPAHFIQLDGLPLNSNGKLDRGKLPDPEGAELSAAGTYLPPVTATEQQLVEIWEEVLNKKGVGMMDNFFELGGHSLKASRLGSLINKIFNVKIKLKTLFENPVLQAQAQWIQEATGSLYVRVPLAREQQNYPLSPSQLRLWMLAQFEAGNIAYNIPAVFVFRGQLDTDALHKAFNAVIDRHESLRTVFKEDEEGMVKQYIIMPGAKDFEIAYHDLRAEQANSQHLKEAVLKSAIQPFDLARGPLLRATLFQIAEAEWIFSFVMHHIICDGQSIKVLMADLMQSYNAFRQGKTSPLQPLRIQYKDYVMWQKEQLSNEGLQAYKSYWLQQFAGDLPVLELPGDKLRPAIKTYNGSQLLRVIDPGISKGFKIMAQEQGATLFMTLLTAVYTLLYRYTSQEDIIIGTPIAGREHADLEEQIGFYVNTLALRAQFSGGDNFKMLLKNIEQVTLGAYEHALYPFGELVDALDIPRDMSRNPLFDIQVILEHADKLTESGLPDDEVLTVLGYSDDELQTSRFDIVFNFTDTGKGLELGTQYNTDIYSPGVIEQLTDHLEQIMAAILRSPALPIQELEYLTAAERTGLLVDFKGPALPVPQHKSVLDFIAMQVALHPLQAAVKFQDTCLTYQQLEEKSNQLAHYLITVHGVQQDDFVGVMLDRSEKMIIGILAILKAGAAYVPIDPEYNEARKEFIIRDTALTLLLSQTDYLFDIPYYEGAIFAMDVQLDDLGTPLVPPAVTIMPHHLAYVIYTSGSTGNPKGVLIEHGNLLHSNLPRQQVYENVQSFLLLSSIAFDSSVAGIFGTLCAGGCLYITKKIDVANVNWLADYIVSEQITHLLTVPSYYQLLLTELSEKENTLRQVVVAGENCPKQLVDDHHATVSLQQCDLFNEYGPTEGTVWSTYCKYDRSKAAISTIGKPVANTAVNILDHRLQLVPVGVTGEICIAGNGLARGYLNSPALTADKFVTNPFMTGTRLYKTGDLGKWLPDGNIVFLGRKDDQVKVRGYRIEPGEIENALHSHPLIDFTVVVARPDKDGVNELIAYVVSKETLQTSMLQPYLAALLPVYAIPTKYIQLDQMPLSPNGKVDKKKLPDPAGNGMESGVVYTAPRNETEEILISVWQNILGKERIGIYDKFFDLGGDSIKVLRMISGVRKQLQLDIPITEIYQNDSVAHLAEYVLTNKNMLEREGSNLAENKAAMKLAFGQMKERILLSGLLPDPANISDIYPMSDIEKGMVFESLFQENSGIYHDQMVRQRVLADFDINRFRKAIRLLADKHAILRTAFNISDFETAVQIVYENVQLDIPYEDLEGINHAQQEETVRHFLQSELQQPFNLSAAPLWRIKIFQLGKDEILLVFQCHHAIIDGWSDASFMTELNNLYLQLATDTDYVPAPLASGYKDFVIQQELDKQDRQVRAYWQHELAGFQRLDLFTMESRFRQHTVSLDTDAVKRLEKFAGNLTTTLKVLSLSAYLYLLQVLNYDIEIVAGLVTNSRPDTEDADKILGCFLNTVPLKMTVDEKLTGSAFVTAVHHKLKELKRYERLSMTEIAGLHNKQLQSRNPFFDVIFNYVDFHVFKTADKEITATEAGNGSEAMHIGGNGTTNTYFDLSVNLTGGLFNVMLSSTRQWKCGFSLEQIGALYIRILNSIVDFPHQELYKAKIVPPPERQQLLTSFNDTAADYDREATLAILFERQVSANPKNTALSFAGRNWTYQSLNETANQLAHYLRDHYRLQPDDLVCIQLVRSEWMVISILAVLKAGAAYVPVDPSFPEERIRYLVEDSQCKACIDAAEIDRFMAAAPSYPTGNLPVINNAHHLAYVIYTSGSTGRPKGCMLEHRGIINRLTWMWAQYGFTTADVILQKTTFTFDVSVWELFLPLCWGARMVLCREEDISQPARILELIEEQKVTCMHFIPGMLQGFIATLFETDHVAQRLESLRLLATSGEALLPETAHAWYTKVNIPLYNLYGPTEASVEVTHYAVHASDTVIPIGQPIWNTNMYILGKEQQLQPIGITGEICIGGEGLARGYLNKADLTAEKFIAHPYQPGVRLYKTGDLGKWLPDGNIVYLGRLDEQVKIRGYRIELGEIENALQLYPGVNGAIVLAQLNLAGEKELVAYVISEEGLPAAVLQDHLGKTLPAYMVPVQYIRVKAFPQTASGKTDRRQLAAEGGVQMTVNEIYVAPRNETEEQLVQAWQQVLGRDLIGVNDNFFSLGGNSLNVMKLVARLNKQYHMRLKIADIYRLPTISQLAVKQPSDGSMVLLSTDSVKSKSNIYFIPPVFGNSAIYKPLAERLSDRFNCYGFQYSGLEKEEPLFSSIADAAMKFSQELLQNQQTGPLIIFGYSMGAMIAFEMAKLLEPHLTEIQLVLVDRGVHLYPDEHTGHALSKEDMALLELEYKTLLEDTHRDVKEIQLFLENNAAILHQYRPDGQVNSRITVFEARDNDLPSNMEEWKAYTKSDIDHGYIAGKHWDALSEVNLDRFTEKIDEILNIHNPLIRG